MPDAVNPSVPIMLDKERHLLFDLNAMAAIEEATGKSIFEEKAIAGLLGGAKGMRLLLWACLLHEDEQLTPKQVAGWVNPGNLRDIAEKLAIAIKIALPEGDGKTNRPLTKKFHQPG